MNDDKMQQTWMNKAAAFLKPWRMLAVFLAIMLILTIVSRINDEKLLPQVTTAEVERMTLDHTVTVEGTVAHTHQQAIFIPENLRIASVSVSEGMMVKKGEALFQIDVKDLENMLAKAKSDTRKQELQTEDRQNAVAQAENANKIAVQRAREDLTSITEMETVTQNQLKDELNKLKEDLEVYQRDPLKKRDSTVLNNLKAAYDTKQQAYNDTISAKAAAITAAARNLEDARDPYILEDKTSLLSRQLSDINRELDILVHIKQDNYWVRSGMDGVIQTVKIKPGDLTGSGMAFLIHDTYTNIDVAVFPEENLKVDSVFAVESSHVAKNAVLYSIEKQSLEHRIEELANEADQLNKQLLNEIQSKLGQTAIKERLVKRAQEDYNRAVEEWYARELEADRQSKVALNAYETYRDHPMETEAMKQACDALEKEYSDKKKAYDLAVLHSENTITVAKRNMENAQNTQVPEQNAAAVMREDLNLMEKQVIDLEELNASNGIITADRDGKVESLTIAAGAVSGKESAVLLSDQTNGYLFTGLMPVDQSKYVNIGDTIQLTVYNRKINRDDLAVTSIQAQAEDPAHYLVMVRIPDSEQALDGTAALTVTKQTEAYQTCVPLKAIHPKDDKSYVYLLSETNTVLGVQSTAEQLEVTILDKNDRYAAVHAEFPTDAKVIAGSNKELTDDCRVRRLD